MDLLLLCNSCYSSLPFNNYYIYDLMMYELLGLYSAIYTQSLNSGFIQSFLNNELYFYTVFQRKFKIERFCVLKMLCFRFFAALPLMQHLQRRIDTKNMKNRSFYLLGLSFFRSFTQHSYFFKTFLNNFDINCFRKAADK